MWCQNNPQACHAEVSHLDFSTPMRFTTSCAIPIKLPTGSNVCQNRSTLMEALSGMDTAAIKASPPRWLSSLTWRASSSPVPLAGGAPKVMRGFYDWKFCWQFPARTHDYRRNKQELAQLFCVVLILFGWLKNVTASSHTWVLPAVMRAESWLLLPMEALYKVQREQCSVLPFP